MKVILLSAMHCKIFWLIFTVLHRLINGGLSAVPAAEQPQQQQQRQQQQQNHNDRYKPTTTTYSTNDLLSTSSLNNGRILPLSHRKRTFIVQIESIFQPHRTTPAASTTSPVWRWPSATVSGWKRSNRCTRSSTTMRTEMSISPNRTT